ncbi:hypothetical protein BKA69DRAFT_1128510 [Paraphysoderma sedebokerense]|nr:hypothetical protein BKA69DRAFT_1128510 [Paraphysoderma sedebokerense]
MSSFGFAFAGPLYQFWYSLLDRKLVEHWMKKKLAPGVSITPQKIQWKMSLQKVIADMFIFDPPYLAFFFITTNVMSGYTFQQSTERMKRDALPTYWVDVAVWTPIQFLNFRFIPVSYQPLVVNGVNVFWNAYLSYVKHK